MFYIIIYRAFEYVKSSIVVFMVVDLETHIQLKQDKILRNIFIVYYVYKSNPEMRRHTCAERPAISVLRIKIRMELENGD